ncbi:MAG: low temperature requirement protein A, partial [Acidimicrobiia bacterium]|nr:low temperature requirement protein A [Acidimicrobiia bacterium]
MSELEDELIEDKAVLPLELFFDLVFVLGITQTVALVANGHDDQALGRAFLVLAMLWWAWTQFSWTANSVDLRPPRVRFAFFAAMGAALIMAVSVPTAFEDGGLWLAAGYVVVRGIGVWLHLSGTTDPKTLAGVRLFAAVSWPGPLVFVVGALVDPPGRSWFWLVGFLLEIGAAGLAGGSAWHLRAGHFAERHGLIYIIAMGEGIVAIGIIAARGPLDSVVAITMLLAVAAAALLWWSYFDRFAEHVEDALREAGEAQGVIARRRLVARPFPDDCRRRVVRGRRRRNRRHPGDHLESFTRLLLALSIGLAMLAQSGVV